MVKLERKVKSGNLGFQLEKDKKFGNSYEKDTKGTEYIRRTFAINNCYNEIQKRELVYGDKYESSENTTIKENMFQKSEKHRNRRSSSMDSACFLPEEPSKLEDNGGDSHSTERKSVLEGFNEYDWEQVKLEEQFRKIVLAALQDRQKYKDLVAISENLEKLGNPAKDICENFRQRVTDFNKGILDAGKALIESETDPEELDMIRRMLTNNSLAICQLRARFRTEVLPTMNMNWVREQTGKDGLGVSGLGFGGEKCTENIEVLMFGDIRYVVDLREVGEAKNNIWTHHKALERVGIAVMHLPTPDNTKNVLFKTLEEGAKFVSEQKGFGVINCKSGSNRSGEMITFILLQQKLKDTIKSKSLKEIRGAVMEVIGKVKEKRKLFAGQPLGMIKSMQKWQREASTENLAELKIE